jgi:SEC-C motif-containing protein
MRSRYSAFVLRNEQYLLATWHPSRRPLEIAFSVEQVWLGLTVIEMHVTGADSAEVEFIAQSRIGKSAEIRHHERSRFVRQGGVWLYVDGLMIG